MQNHLSELFRIARGRNDDFNLASLSAIRAPKQLQIVKQGIQNPQACAINALLSQQKILSDLQSREESRLQRERQILKELALMNKLSASSFALVDRHFRKMIRKVFILTLNSIDKVPNRSKNCDLMTGSLPLNEALPAHLHVAAIMGESTQQDKEMFGKLKLEQALSEDNIDLVIDAFVETQSYYELVIEVLERARDRLAL